MNSSPRSSVLNLTFLIVAALEERPCHRHVRDSHRLAPPGVPPVPNILKSCRGMTGRSGASKEIR